MKKYIKQHLKSEKRILKLLYRKGIINKSDFKNLEWCYYLHGKRIRNRRNKNKYHYVDYLPELCQWSTDYWGESDTHSWTSYFHSIIYWGNVEYINDEYIPTIKSRIITPQYMIKELKKMKDINKDSSFNKYLKVNKEY